MISGNPTPRGSSTQSRRFLILLCRRLSGIGLTTTFSLLELGVSVGLSDPKLLPENLRIQYKDEKRLV